MLNQANIYRKAYFARQFELMVVRLIKDKSIKQPVYLSIGQEHVAAIVSELYPNSFVFPQHRCHSWFLSYGGKPEVLLKHLLGVVDDECNGMQGSASLAIPGKMFGHSGLLGDQIPIAVGFADSKRQHTICVCGDAAMEEDYALGALGYAATQKCPITFIVEDNNLSILTKKEVRRSWDIVHVARGFGIDAYDIKAKPVIITDYLRQVDKDEPYLLNINVERHYWHAGAGQDNEPEFDFLPDLKYKTVIDKDGKFASTLDTHTNSLIEQLVHTKIEELWELSQKLLKK